MRIDCMLKVDFSDSKYDFKSRWHFDTIEKKLSKLRVGEKIDFATLKWLDDSFMDRNNVMAGNSAFVITCIEYSVYQSVLTVFMDFASLPGREIPSYIKRKECPRVKGESKTGITDSRAMNTFKQFAPHYYDAQRDYLKSLLFKGYTPWVPKKKIGEARAILAYLYLRALNLKKIVLVDPSRIRDVIQIMPRTMKSPTISSISSELSALESEYEGNKERRRAAREKMIWEEHDLYREFCREWEQLKGEWEKRVRVSEDERETERIDRDMRERARELDEIQKRREKERKQRESRRPEYEERYDPWQEEELRKEWDLQGVERRIRELRKKIKQLEEISQKEPWEYADENEYDKEWDSLSSDLEDEANDADWTPSCMNNPANNNANNTAGGGSPTNNTNNAPGGNNPSNSSVISISAELGWYTTENDGLFEFGTIYLCPKNIETFDQTVFSALANQTVINEARIYGVEKTLELLYKLVFLHEMGHLCCCMFNGVTKAWEDETLANWIASMSVSLYEREMIYQKTQKQPPEYQAFLTLPQYGINYTTPGEAQNHDQYAKKIRPLLEKTAKIC